jgi:hypothetical protein
LADGEEILYNDTVETKSGSFAGYPWNSDPTDDNTDDSGANDSEEIEAGSDPTSKEILFAGYMVPTATNEEGKPITAGERADLTSASPSDQVVFTETSGCPGIFNFGDICSKTGGVIFIQTNKAGGRLAGDVAGEITINPDGKMIQPRTSEITLSQKGIRRFRVNIRSVNRNCILPIFCGRADIDPGVVDAYAGFKFKLHPGGFRSNTKGLDDYSKQATYATPESSLLVNTAKFADTASEIYSDKIKASCKISQCGVSAGKTRRTVRFFGAGATGFKDLPTKAALKGIGAFSESAENVRGPGGYNHKMYTGIYIKITM